MNIFRVYMNIRRYMNIRSPSPGPGLLTHSKIYLTTSYVLKYISLILSGPVVFCIYIHIHIYTHTYTYTYPYVKHIIDVYTYMTSPSFFLSPLSLCLALSVSLSLSRNSPPRSPNLARARALSLYLSIALSLYLSISPSRPLALSCSLAPHFLESRNQA